MLPKSQRLRTSDFKEFRGSSVFHTPHFLLRVKKGAASFRAAAVVSAAVAKKAVERNLLRRRVYAILERLPPPLPTLLLTVTAKKGASALSFAAIRDELAPVLQKTREVS